MTFIIPAYNEQQYISSLIDSINRIGTELSYQTIVVDNGSTDSTSDIACNMNNVVVFKIQPSTISYARNYGASKATSEVIIFLDADVRLSNEWHSQLLKRINEIKEKTILTGSRYVIPEDPSWIEKYWFLPLSRKKTSYINGGNIITNKKTMALIGGFDESLETGEDVDFSIRAKKKGIVIDIDPGFKAIHDGYPKTIKQFCKREIWHGKGDYKNISTFIKSKIAILSFIFGVLHFACLMLLIIGDITMLLLALALIAVMSSGMSIFIFRRYGMRHVVTNIVLCYFYLMSRFISFLTVLKG